LIAGDWNGNGVESPGLFRPSNATVYLRYENSQGNADESWTVGQSAWLPVAGKFGNNLPPPPTTTTTTTTTTTVPGTDHPQSGVGWEFLGCSNAAGTCSYPQSAVESQLKIDWSLLPPKYCLPAYPSGCLIEGNQWQFHWYDSGGSTVSGSCSFSYDGGFLESVTCKMPIAGAATGEYRGELCRSEWPSSTCVETLLTTYFKITG
jgi:hypothetical protein